MSNDNKIHRTLEEQIHFALKQEIPPLYRPQEIDGVIVKCYPFIQGHSKIKKHKFSAKDIEQKDYSSLIAHKSEIENQLKLHRKYCIYQYTHHIKNEIRNWLEDKIQREAYNLDSNEENRGQIPLLVLQINSLIHGVLRGVEGETIIRNLKEPPIPLPQANETASAVYREEWETIVSNFSELFHKINRPLKNIERVVSRSVDLYFEYLNIHSCLNEYNHEEMLSINKINKLIKTFVWKKFNPKAHDKQMIEDYLIRWEQNQGLGYPRKTTVDELKSDYPKLGEIYNSSSSVIFNWEERWKKYKDARTEK